MPSFFDKNCITEFVGKNNAIDPMYLDFRFHITLLEEVAKIKKQSHDGKKRVCLGFQ